MVYDACKYISSSPNIMKEVLVFLQGGGGEGGVKGHEGDGAALTVQISFYSVEGNEGRTVELITSTVMSHICTHIYNLVDDLGVVSLATIASNFDLPIEFVQQHFVTTTMTTMTIISETEKNTHNDSMESNHSDLKTDDLKFVIENAITSGRLFVCKPMLECCDDLLLSALQSTNEPTILNTSLIHSLLHDVISSGSSRFLLHGSNRQQQQQQQQQVQQQQNHLNEDQKHEAVLEMFFKVYIVESVTKLCKLGLLQGSVRGGGLK
jgi:hypothetical protein